MKKNIVDTKASAVIREKVAGLISESVTSLSPEVRKSLKDSFARNGFMKIENFGVPDLQRMIRYEVDYLLELFSTRRDLNIAATGNTPRSYRTVRQLLIRENGTIIPLFFRNEALLELLNYVCEGTQRVNPVPYEPEEYIITNQRQSGDTHGWHWDDYSLALVWIIKSPRPEEGGLLEFVSNTSWDKSDPKIDQILASREIERVYLAPGTLYLLKADTALHRVAPLKGGERAAVVFTYASDEELVKDVTHETMEQIYELAPAGSGATP